MNNKMRKIFSFLLALVMVLGLFPGGVRFSPAVQAAGERPAGSSSAKLAADTYIKVANPIAATGSGYLLTYKAGGNRYVVKADANQDPVGAISATASPDGNTISGAGLGSHEWTITTQNQNYMFQSKKDSSQYLVVDYTGNGFTGYEYHAKVSSTTTHQGISRTYNLHHLTMKDTQETFTLCKAWEGGRDGPHYLTTDGKNSRNLAATDITSKATPFTLYTHAYQVDTAALRAAIQWAKTEYPTENEYKYTPNTWEAFQQKLTAAETCLSDIPADTYYTEADAIGKAEAANQAQKNLYLAVDGLKRGENKITIHMGNRKVVRYVRYPNDLSALENQWNLAELDGKDVVLVAFYCESTGGVHHPYLIKKDGTAVDVMQYFGNDDKGRHVLEDINYCSQLQNDTEYQWTAVTTCTDAVDGAPHTGTLSLHDTDGYFAASKQGAGYVLGKKAEAFAFGYELMDVKFLGNMWLYHDFGEDRQYLDVTMDAPARAYVTPDKPTNQFVTFSLFRREDLEATPGYLTINSSGIDDVLKRANRLIAQDYVPDTDAWTNFEKARTNANALKEQCDAFNKPTSDENRAAAADLVRQLNVAQQELIRTMGELVPLAEARTFVQVQQLSSLKYGETYALMWRDGQGNWFAVVPNETQGGAAFRAISITSVTEPAGTEPRRFTTNQLQDGLWQIVGAADTLELRKIDTRQGIHVEGTKLSMGTTSEFSFNKNTTQTANFSLPIKNQGNRYLNVDANGDLVVDTTENDQFYFFKSTEAGPNEVRIPEILWERTYETKTWNEQSSKNGGAICNVPFYQVTGSGANQDKTVITTWDQIKTLPLGWKDQYQTDSVWDYGTEQQLVGTKAANTNVKAATWTHGGKGFVDAESKAYGSVRRFRATFTWPTEFDAGDQIALVSRNDDMYQEIYDCVKNGSQDLQQRYGDGYVLPVNDTIFMFFSTSTGSDEPSTWTEEDALRRLAFWSGTIGQGVWSTRKLNNEPYWSNTRLATNRGIPANPSFYKTKPNLGDIDPNLVDDRLAKPEVLRQLDWYSIASADSIMSTALNLYSLRELQGKECCIDIFAFDEAAVGGMDQWDLQFIKAGPDDKTVRIDYYVQKAAGAPDFLGSSQMSGKKVKEKITLLGGVYQNELNYMKGDAERLLGIPVEDGVQDATLTVVNDDAQNVITVTYVPQVPEFLTYDFALKNQYTVDLPGSAGNDVSVTAINPTDQQYFSSVSASGSGVTFTFQPPQTGVLGNPIAATVTRGSESQLIAIIPASNVLYEENYLIPDGTAAEGIISTWEQESAATEITGPVTNNSDRYGFSTLYEGSKGHNGIWKTTLANQPYSYSSALTFDMVGEAFDIIGTAGPDTATLVVSAENLKTGKIQKILMVDTASLKMGTLHQVPLVHVTGLDPANPYRIRMSASNLPRKTNTVTLQAANADSFYLNEMLMNMGYREEDLELVEYSTLTDGQDPCVSLFAVNALAEPTAGNAPTMEIDGFRVYRNAKNVANAYLPSERDVEYVNVTEKAKSGLAVYVESSKKDTTDPNVPSDGDMDIHYSFNVAEYNAQGGPKNELYLRKGNCVVFNLGTESANKRIQISARSVEDGKSACLASKAGDGVAYAYQALNPVDGSVQVAGYDTASGTPESVLSGTAADPWITGQTIVESPENRYIQWQVSNEPVSVGMIHYEGWQDPDATGYPDGRFRQVTVIGYNGKEEVGRQSFGVPDRDMSAVKDLTFNNPWEVTSLRVQIDASKNDSLSIVQLQAMEVKESNPIGEIQPRVISHNTEMYYTVEKDEKGLLAITNTGEGILALGNLKLYTPSAAEEPQIYAVEPVMALMAATALYTPRMLPAAPPAPPESEEPELPTPEPTVFAPEYVDLRSEFMFVNYVGILPVHEIVTSQDVAYITVDGTRIERYYTGWDRRTGRSLQHFRLPAESFFRNTQYTVVAYDDDGNASETIYLTRGAMGGLFDSVFEGFWPVNWQGRNPW